LLRDGPTPGRLSSDLDPPSFESLASVMSGRAGSGAVAKTEPQRSKSVSGAPKAVDLRKIRQAQIAAAKVSLQGAKRSLSDARATAQSLEAAQKKATAEAKEAEKYRREAAERLDKATAASEAAARRAQTVATEVAEANEAVEDTKRTVAEATKELESLLRGPM